MSSADLHVLLFRVGRHYYMVDQSLIRAFSVAGLSTNAADCLVPLSLLLGLKREPSVDQRILVVEHGGKRVGLLVTNIEGLRILAPSQLRPLPGLINRLCVSSAVLGIVLRVDGEEPFLRSGVLALDLKRLLAEQADKLPLQQRSLG